MAQHLSKNQFVKALSTLKKPGGSQVKFLRAHATAKGRAMTMRRLAEAAGYKAWRGVNLRYGILGRTIGEAAGANRRDIYLLVEFIAPKGHSVDNLSNSEWILVMNEDFATALESVGWI